MSIYTNRKDDRITYVSKFSKDVTGVLVGMLWPGETGYPGDSSTRWSPDGERMLPKQPIAVIVDRDGQETWFNWATWWAVPGECEEDSPRTLWASPQVEAAYEGSEIRLWRDENGHQHLELI